MATITTFADDLDGSTPAETVTFSVRGQNFTIDLGEKNLHELTALLDKHAEELSKFISAARPVTVSTKTQKAKPDYDPATVRLWAAENGYDVSERGRIPSDVIEAWRNKKPAQKKVQDAPQKDEKKDQKES